MTTLYKYSVNTKRTKGRHYKAPLLCHHSTQPIKICRRSPLLPLCTAISSIQRRVLSPVVGLRSKDRTLKLGREDSLLSTQLHSVQNLLTLQRKNVSKRKVLLIYQLLLVSRSAGGVVFCCCFFVFHSFMNVVPDF